MSWEITFPNLQTPHRVPLFDGRFVAAGVGPPGQIKRLFAKLRILVDGTPQDLLIGHPIQSGHDTGANKHRWAVLFDFRCDEVDFNATYQIELWVATGNTAQMVGRPLDGLRFTRGRFNLAGDPGVQLARAPVISYPLDGATVSRTGAGSYGTVTVPGEIVPATGGNLGGVESTSGTMQSNGFWWVSFPTLTAGPNQLLVVTSSTGATDRKTVNVS